MGVKDRRLAQVPFDLLRASLQVINKSVSWVCRRASWDELLNPTGRSGGAYRINRALGDTSVSPQIQPASLPDERSGEMEVLFSSARLFCHQSGNSAMESKTASG